MLAAQPVVGRHTQQEQPARLEHPPQLGQGRAVTADSQVVDDLEARRDVEGSIGERQALDRGSGKAEIERAGGFERLPGQIDADHRPEARQTPGRSAGAAASVENQQVASVAERTLEHRQRDAPHACVPPVALLAARHDRVLLTLHAVRKTRAPVRLRSRRRRRTTLDTSAGSAPHAPGPRFRATRRQQNCWYGT